VDAVNACDESLVTTRERTGAAAPPPVSVESAIPPAEGGRASERWLLTRLSRVLGHPPVDFAIQGGAQLTRGGAASVARVTFASRAKLLWILGDPWLRFGDAYSDGDVLIDGDLVTLLEAVYRAGGAAGGRPSLLRRAITARQRNTLSGSRENIHHHYDIGNDFYALWLGDTMAYTCAYYPTPAAALDEAQTAKMDHVCRKLRLKPGESVVEAGCGWGVFAMHMARRYGVRVRAFNISHEQVAYARERAAREGLSGRVEYIEDDYRNISGSYDVFVSIGMLEHVGVANYEALGGIVRRTIGECGRGLIHSIGRNHPATLNGWIQKRIFPGAHPPSLSEMSRIFEPWDLSVLDVENLRLHYAQTLRHWLSNYEAASARVREMFDERFVRMWRLYLAGSLAAFSTGSLQLFQVLFAPPGNNDIAWTRAHLYAP
jgi:cyclopropane-fatty-acyl-phospholipid synthase